MDRALPGFTEFDRFPSLYRALPRFYRSFFCFFFPLDFRFALVANRTANCCCFLLLLLLLLYFRVARSATCGGCVRQFGRRQLPPALRIVARVSCLNKKKPKLEVKKKQTKQNKKQTKPTNETNPFDSRSNPLTTEIQKESPNLTDPMQSDRLPIKKKQTNAFNFNTNNFVDLDNNWWLARDGGFFFCLVSDGTCSRRRRRLPFSLDARLMVR